MITVIEIKKNAELRRLPPVAYELGIQIDDKMRIYLTEEVGAQFKRILDNYLKGGKF